MNMPKKYLKVISLGIKNSLSLEGVIMALLEYGLYFVFLVFIFKNISIFTDTSTANLNVSAAIYLLFIYLYKLFLENVLVFRYLLVSDNFDLLSLKPLNTFFRLMLSKTDIIGLVVSLAMVVATLSFGGFPNLVPIFVSLILALTLFILVLVFLLQTNGRIAFEKLLLFIFPIGLIGVGEVVDGLPILLVSILFLAISVKFWSFALSRYASPNL